MLKLFELKGNRFELN